MLVTALEASRDLPAMETAVKMLLHEELKSKDRSSSRITGGTDKEQALMTKLKKRGSRYYFTRGCVVSCPT